MNTCPTCPNDLVCHDQGECLRPTPDSLSWHTEYLRASDRALNLERQLAEARAICEELVTDSNAVTLAETVVRLERERNEAREAFAIATSQLVQVQGELRQAREENARLREAIKRLAELDFGSQGWDEQCNRAAAVLRNLVKP